MLRVAVAASGGRDSTALLHATVRAARGTNLRVVALHVHHGLNPAADGWQDAVRRQCGRWGVAFSTRRLATRPAAGQSIEAWARHERYAALAELATEAGCTLVLLAHHRRDQAETWLLQALRGAGVAGLSAMPAARIASGITWARPWLASPRDAVEAYVRRHRLSFVEDDSNADPRFDRNRLRLQVWPMLKRAFPDVEGSLAAAARRAQQATALAVEVAAHDLVDLRRERGGLRVSHWRELPPARRRNALAAWLLQTLPKGVPGTLVDRLLAEVPQSAAARWPAPGGEVRLYRGAMTFVSSG
ncbi:MAG: tRNA lysidine(34) synthetase TilS, partial [Caldimonas sp.]